MFSDVSNLATSDLESVDANFEFWMNFEDDLFGSPLAFDASETGLWNGKFVPPPPRPDFLEDTVVSDGLTTCDLCSWAVPDKNAFLLDGSIGKKMFNLFLDKFLNLCGYKTMISICTTSII